MTDEQKEVLAMLPNNIKKSNDFSLKAKTLLAYLIHYGSSEYATENGFFYKTNSDLMKDSGLSNKGIGIVLHRFQELCFITRILGKFKGNASSYTVNLDIINAYGSSEVKGELSEPKGEVNGEVRSELSEPKGEVNGEVSSELSEPKGEVTLSEKYNELLLKIDVMSKKISELEALVKGEVKGELSEPKGEVKVSALTEPQQVIENETVKGVCETKGEVAKFTTEPETDTEIEINYTSNSTRLEEISNKELLELIEEVFCKIEQGGDSVVEIYRLKKKLSGRLTPTQVELFNYKFPDDPITSPTSKHPK